MPILCMRFKCQRERNELLYFVGNDAEEMRRDAALFEADPDSGEMMDLDRVKSEWPPNASALTFDQALAASKHSKSFYLFTQTVR